MSSAAWAPSPAPTSWPGSPSSPPPPATRTTSKPSYGPTPRVPDRGAARAGAGPSPLPALTRGLQALASVGCGAVAIPCNTAHGWIDGMRAATSLPILHIVDAAIEDLRRQRIPPGPIGVLGTAATLAMRLYQDPLHAAAGPASEPTEAEMARLVTPAIARVQANQVAEAYAPITEMLMILQARGAQAVVLGCTEIPLAVQAGPWQSLGIPIIDTIDALARASIKWAQPPTSAPPG